jgi:hypothetical protein
MEEDIKTYPEGYFVSRWMAIGAAALVGIGVPLFVITGNPGLMGIGPAIGVSLGMAVGSAIENKYKKEGEIRPLTEAEAKRKKTALPVATGLLTLLAIIGLVIFLNRL